MTSFCVLLNVKSSCVIHDMSPKGTGRLKSFVRSTLPSSWLNRYVEFFFGKQKRTLNKKDINLSDWPENKIMDAV